MESLHAWLAEDTPETKDVLMYELLVSQSRAHLTQCLARVLAQSPPTPSAVGVVLKMLELGAEPQTGQVPFALSCTDFTLASRLLCHSLYALSMADWIDLYLPLVQKNLTSSDPERVAGAIRLLTHASALLNNAWLAEELRVCRIARKMMKQNAPAEAFCDFVVQCAPSAPRTSRWELINTLVLVFDLRISSASWCHRVFVVLQKNPDVLICEEQRHTLERAAQTHASPFPCLFQDEDFVKCFLDR
jgi:hypothetical protein